MQHELEAMTEVIDGHRCVYFPYSSSSSSLSKRRGSTYYSPEEFRAIWSDIILIWRGGPAHGWKCFFQRGEQVHSGTYGHGASIHQDAPDWAKEAHRHFFGN